MAANPIAFVSYAHADDEYDRGSITDLARRIEGAVRAFTGRTDLEVFFDRRSIAWGDHWRDRIASGLSSSVILIAVVTPHYLASAACRDELTSFLAVSASKGWLLPIYYIDVADLRGCSDHLVKVLHEHQYEDWRSLRTNSRTSLTVRRAIERLAKRIRDLLEEAKGAEEATARMSVVTSDSSHEYRAHSTLVEEGQDDVVDCGIAAQAAFDDEEYGLARALLLSGLERFNNDLDLMFLLGTVDWYDGALAEAVAEFEKVIALGADTIVVLGNLGQVRVEMGDFERGVHELTRVINANRDYVLSAYARSSRALAFAGLGQSEKALAELALAEKITPSNAWLHFNRARVLDWQANESAQLSYVRSLALAGPSLNRPKRLLAQRRLVELGWR
jgi:tetratricopeptide (TPR) repeat protein